MHVVTLLATEDFRGLDAADRGAAHVDPGDAHGAEPGACQRREQPAHLGLGRDHAAGMVQHQQLVAARRAQLRGTAMEQADERFDIVDPAGDLDDQAIRLATEDRLAGGLFRIVPRPQCGAFARNGPSRVAAIAVAQPQFRGAFLVEHARIEPGLARMQFAVFELLQPFEKDRRSLLRADVSNDSTHSPFSLLF